MIVLEKTKKKYLEKIIDLLSENISNFKPKKNLNFIWSNFKNQKHVFSFTALYNGKIQGYGSIVFEYKIRGGVVGHIEDIVVDRQFRRKKIGTKIIKRLISLAKKKNCYKLILQTKKQKEFYKSLGFKKNGYTYQFLI
jgi:glucosamine-phosphate N-acetyltransferase